MVRKKVVEMEARKKESTYLKLESLKTKNKTKEQR